MSGFSHPQSTKIGYIWNCPGCTSSKRHPPSPLNYLRATEHIPSFAKGAHSRAGDFISQFPDAARIHSFKVWIPPAYPVMLVFPVWDFQVYLASWSGRFHNCIESISLGWFKNQLNTHIIQQLLGTKYCSKLYSHETGSITANCTERNSQHRSVLILRWHRMKLKI